jgi:F420-non-reducing hydrogenase iron-sulfur subunit
MYVLKAFEGGADGVLVAGCHLADCHYLDGPVKCDAMTDKLRKVLHILGLEDERFRREMVSASEGVIFARIIKDMVEQLKKLGPSPFKAKTEAVA